MTPNPPAVRPTLDLLALFTHPNSQSPATRENGVKGDLESDAISPKPRPLTLNVSVQDSIAAPCPRPSANEGTMDHGSSLYASAVPSLSSTTPAVSRFHPVPITKGPFDPSKYGRPIITKKTSTPKHHALASTNNEPVCSLPEHDQSQCSCTGTRARPFRTSTSIGSITFQESQSGATPNLASTPYHWHLPNQPDSEELRPTRLRSPVDHVDSTPSPCGAMSRISSSAKPATEFVPPTIGTTSFTSKTSQVLALRPSSVSEHFTPPSTQGRPLVDSHNNSDFQTGKMPNSNQANTHSVISASAHPGESPMEHLQRLQRNAMGEVNINSRRRNRHDTASPEVLAYIRRPLDPQVNAVVEHRVAHYWKIGSENLDPTASVGVEPNWPESLHDSKPERDRSSHKSLKELIRTTSTAPVDSPVTSRKVNPRWVSNAEVRAPPPQPNSNAWGSGPSTATTADSQDSVRAEGKPRGGVKLSDINAHETSLAGWDGRMQPPPVDWHDRPRFDNSTVEFHNHFNNWGNARAEELIQALGSSSVSFRVIDSNEVLDLSNHADGLSFVPATTTVNAQNAEYYGYACDSELKELAKTSTPLTKDDFKYVCAVQLDDPSTAALADETTELLVQRWIGQNGWLKNKRVPTGKTAEMLAPPPHYQTSQAAETPEIRVSLRPATVSDIPGMTRIYNWYIENSSKTTEFDPIPEHDMRGRFDDVQSNKLPFIVAVARSRARAPFCHRPGRSAQVRHGNVSGHPVLNTNPAYQGMTQEDTILGWVCASDLTASDYVERITAECELYVAHDARHFGVGKALMDKLLEACDRGYIKQGNYDWRCAPDIQHLYCTGGGRDLHKLYFVIRKWSQPVQAPINGSAGNHERHVNASHKWNDQEDEFEIWLKEWMETWGFEVEGVLKKVGAKNGRFLDVVYMGRETMWQPQEGKIPNPLTGS